MTAADGSRAQATGTHAREAFVRLFFALYRHQRTGTLEVSFGRKHRVLYLVGGEPVAYTSDLPEDELSRTLVNANIVPIKQMKWVKDKLSEGEHLEDALLMSGSIAAEQLSAHKRNRLRVSIGSPLLWGSGEWSFTPAPSLRAERIDPKLRPASDCLAAIWHAVVQHVSMDTVFPKVTDPAAGTIELDPICPALFPAFEVDVALSGVPKILMDGASVDDVFRMVPDSSGNLVKLLWFLEAAGMVRRTERPEDTDLEARIETAFASSVSEKSRAAAKGKKEAKGKTVADAEAQPTTSAQKADRARGQRQATTPKRRTYEVPSDDQIRAGHRKRMGRDYYAFLGLPPTSGSAGIDRKCKGLARRWRAAQSERTLSPDVQEKVEALLAGVQLVWRVLTDPGKRAEYDKRLSQGRAPRVGDLRATSGAAPGPGGGAPQVEINSGEDDLAPMHKKAHALISQDRFGDALVLLKKARLNNPSSANIMADLGYVTWKLKGTKNGDAEEFLRLALTFDPENARGLETLARISVDSDDLELAQKLLKQLIRVADDPTWARNTLAKLDKGRKAR